MSDERRATGRSRTPWPRRRVRFGLAVLGFGGAAVFSHFWLGESWSDVLWLAIALIVVWTAAQEVVQARGRRHGRRQER
ncbi:hypothetical protein J8N05_21360 [Streptomyces sp. BH-SS-21]|uniref:Uncharacterized protein n=1 Tax=Streptomyces liliiviolaceus TaxID=2823109 RepID=A0A940XXH6_9ACTN|nr:hypothetical protein [Streptomyces liliiviolaceus]MBQ0850713.1 hypothetical protein [Streptomyces liliiviolaceus]